MLVHKVDELVLGRVLKLVVALGLAVSDKILSIEIIQVYLDLASHTLALHRFATVAEEIEVLHTTHLLEALHDALAHDVSLLGVSQNAHGLIQVAIVSAEMSLYCSAQHLYYL
jgi:hypothetical protein